MICGWRLFASLVFACTVTVLTARAADEPEKFALIVGETDYLQPKDYAISVLRGPANDVALIRRLLVEHYGFKDDSAHIKVLTGSAASRAGITHAFQTQLIDNAIAHPNAKVVFYFSGHGSTMDAPVNAEPDGKYDTLVAYDSRVTGGRDIAEDEFRAWLDTLRRYTPNITTILDSCDSGRVTRGQALVRGLPPNPNMKMPVANKSVESDPTPHFLRRQQYVAIAASEADEFSYEDVIAENNGKVDGFLTWALYQTLNRQPALSWRQAMAQVRRAVAAQTTQQHPQIAGDLDREVFGGAIDYEAPFLAITSIGADGSLTVGAGLAQGLRVGATLAVYAPTAKILVGDDERLATATVTLASLGSSRAIIDESPAPTIPLTAKVAIVTPFYGTTPLSLRADKLANQKTTDADQAVLAIVREKLAKNPTVKATDGDRGWKYAIQRGCLGKDGQLARADATECQRVYYIAGAQDLAPALNRFILVGPEAADGIVDAAVRLSRRSALRALDNSQSRLKIDIELLGIDVQKTREGDLMPGSPHLLNRTSPAYVNVGEYFTFAIKNDSDKPIYFALLILNNDGTIVLVSDSPTGDRLLPHARVELPSPLQAAVPTGIDTYKVIATTQSDIDFTVLQTPDTARAGVISPLQAFLSNAASIHSKNGAVASGLKVGDWVTNQIDVDVQLPKSSARP